MFYPLNKCGSFDSQRFWEMNTVTSVCHNLWYILNSGLVEKKRQTLLWAFRGLRLVALTIQATSHLKVKKERLRCWVHVQWAIYELLLSFLEMYIVSHLMFWPDDSICMDISESADIYRQNLASVASRQLPLNMTYPKMIWDIYRCSTTLCDWFWHQSPKISRKSSASLWIRKGTVRRVTSSPWDAAFMR